MKDTNVRQKVSGFYVSLALHREIVKASASARQTLSQWLASACAEQVGKPELSSIPRQRRGPKGQ